METKLFWKIGWSKLYFRSLISKGRTQKVNKLEERFLKAHENYKNSEEYKSSFFYCHYQLSAINILNQPTN